jgi:hypothetical protein
MHVSERMRLDLVGQKDLPDSFQLDQSAGAGHDMLQMNVAVIYALRPAVT